MNRKDLRRIQSFQAYPCVTILVPTHRAMPGRMQDPIRIKDLAGKATDRLLEEYSKRDVLPIATAIDKLIEKINFSELLDGLAFFVNKDVAEVFILPFNVNEKITIDKTFYTRDLVRQMNRSVQYWVLSVSEKPTRLFSVFGNNIQEIIDENELRLNMRGFPFELNYDVTSDRELLAYGTGDLDSKYITDQKINFMHRIDELLDDYFTNDPRPLVILGTQDNRACFEKVTKHKRFIIGQSEGDFSRVPALEILNVTSKIIDDYIALEQKLAIELFSQAVGELRHSFGIKKVWRAAQEGRVHMLLVEKDYNVPGTVNPDNPENIVLYEESNLPTVSDDIVDNLIEEVIEKGGKVVFVPDGSLKEYEHIGAILRY